MSDVSCQVRGDVEPLGESGRAGRRPFSEKMKEDSGRQPGDPSTARHFRAFAPIGRSSSRPRIAPAAGRLPGSDLQVACNSSSRPLWPSVGCPVIAPLLAAVAGCSGQRIVAVSGRRGAGPGRHQRHRDPLPTGIASSHICLWSHGYDRRWRRGHRRGPCHAVAERAQRLSRS